MMDKVLFPLSNWLILAYLKSSILIKKNNTKETQNMLLLDGIEHQSYFWGFHTMIIRSIFLPLDA